RARRLHRRSLQPDARVPDALRARCRPARRLDPDRRRRVRGDYRAVGLRQVDAPPPARLRRRSDQRIGEIRGAGRGGPFRVRARTPPAHARRVRLPALLPAADAGRARERRAAAGRGRRPAGRAAAARRRAAGLCGPRRAGAAPARSALRRRDAARGDRARAGEPTGAAACRRADGRARRGNRRADRGALRSRQRGWNGHRARHPQPAARRAGGAAAGHAGREARAVMLRVAWRSLLTRPVRAAVLAAGFGFGIAVMAVLLGVGEVIVEQARAPVLAGGGDLVLTGPFGPVTSARYVLSVLDAPDIRSRLAA